MTVLKREKFLLADGVVSVGAGLVGLFVGVPTNNATMNLESNDHLFEQSWTQEYHTLSLGYCPQSGIYRNLDT